MAKMRPGWLTRITHAIFATILICANFAHGHSFAERIMRVAPNGTTIGEPGVSRGFIPRDFPHYADNMSTYLIPQTPNGRANTGGLWYNDTLAHPAQRTWNYTAPHNPLTAAPGDMVVIQYTENGHVTKWQTQPTKPLNRGTVYIYGTSDFDGNANLLDIHYRWNADGTGGDRKGRLLATRNYDDEQCHEDSNQPLARQREAQFPKNTTEGPMFAALYCQNAVALPTDIAAGKNYTLLWVWDWPTMDRGDVALPPSSAPGAPSAPLSPPSASDVHIVYPEIYTTVLDINIVDPCDEALGEVKAPTCATNGKSQKKFRVTEKDLNVAVLQTQLDNMFQVDYTGIFDSSPANPDPNPKSPGSSAGLETLLPSRTSACTVENPAASTASTANDAGVTTTTTTAPAAVVTVTSSLSGGQKGRVKTTTVYDTTEVTTVTVYPSSTSAKASGGIATQYTTVTSAATTVTTTMTTSPALSQSSTPTPGTGSTANTGHPSGTGRPTVTHFVKDHKPYATNKGRRSVGQWGFGRGQA